MANATVYAMPLNHGDKQEYLRLRRNIEGIGKTGLVVAYEFPATESMKHFFSTVMGDPTKDFDQSLILAMKDLSLTGNFIENIVLNFSEIDRAMRMGIVSEALPVDIGYNMADGKGRISHASARAAREERLGEMLYQEISEGAQFRRIVRVLKEDMVALLDVQRVRNMEMKRHVEELIKAGKTDIVLMVGTDHIPWMKRNIGREHIKFQELEDPKDVAGIWWVNYKAMQEANRLRHTNMAGIELARLAVMLSMRALKNGAGEGELSEEEVAAVGRIETPQEAERQYLLTQKRYREGAAVEVAKIKRD